MRTPTTISRRQFLAALGGAAAATVLGALVVDPTLARARGVTSAVVPSPVRAPLRQLVEDVRPTRHRAPDTSRMAWVWDFDEDGEREYVRDMLAQHGLGIVLKTHDGVQWMNGIENEEDPRSAEERLTELVAFFEDAHVPFHCWCVVTGEDPVREAEMASTVLNAGARSIALDLESYDGFWQGTRDTAVQFGHELRSRQPNAVITTTVDSRPWEIDAIPLTEFAAFSNAILPQTYWGMFDDKPNAKNYRRSGYEPGSNGVTPRFVLDTAAAHLKHYGRPIAPIGDGGVWDPEAWTEFLDGIKAHRMPGVSVWRFGITSPGVLAMMRQPRA